MNGRESETAHASFTYTYTKPKPIPNSISNPNLSDSNDSDKCETKEYICVFMVVCWITFLIWGFIYLLTRDVEETDDDNPRPGGMHGRLRM
tara:strand:+ start:576 stop:848 length:273 start_codon:yes stop_codon:yes gene_type:complete